jgi:CubicO group peptidase (beta-lactamase class C family)
MLLGFIVEDAGERAFASQAAEMLASLTSEPLMFNPPAALRSSIAPTENDLWRGRRLVGEVHDENCWALVARQGTPGCSALQKGSETLRERYSVRSPGRDARLARAETVRLFVARYSAATGSRALGWDTMLPTSSCGTKISPAAFGHTGFTGNFVVDRSGTALCM